MLTQSQINEYNEVGAIVVPDILSATEVHELQSVTEDFVRKSAAITAHNDVYDLEDSHSAGEPRVRRIKTPHLHHTAYRALIDHKKVTEALSSLIGPNIRFDTAKLNMKSAGFGAAVEWHQDWAFYPHTNDDLLAVGLMMDDMDLQNGPLMFIPDTHRGPIFDHHAEGKFCGAMDPGKREVDYTKAVPLTGRAGSITIHHVRAVHGSAPNTSAKERRLLLYQFRAADAWPLLGFPQGLEAYDKLMAAGHTDSVVPRLTPVPVRLPLPPADLAGSIYENQKGLKNKFFDTPARTLEPAK